MLETYNLSADKDRLMDCDICSVCHSHIDYSKLDEAYPHLTGGSDHLPPQGMSPLEEGIYWGTICTDCARSAEACADAYAETETPGKPRIRILPPPANENPAATNSSLASSTSESV